MIRRKCEPQLPGDCKFKQRDFLAEPASCRELSPSPSRTFGIEGSKGTGPFSSSPSRHGRFEWQTTRKDLLMSGASITSPVQTCLRVRLAFAAANLALRGHGFVCKTCSCGMSCRDADA